MTPSTILWIILAALCVPAALLLYFGINWLGRSTSVDRDEDALEAEERVTSIKGALEAQNSRWDDLHTIDPEHSMREVHRPRQRIGDSAR
jgi:uncharacterized membrane protein